MLNLQGKAILKFIGAPKFESPKEKSFWRRFLAFVNPWARKAGNILDEASGITKDYYEAEISIKRSQAEKFAAEAAEVAAKANKTRLETTSLMNEEIKKIFESDLPEHAKLLQVANLLKENPQIEEQANKILLMIKQMEVINLSTFSLKIKDSDITKRNIRANSPKPRTPPPVEPEDDEDSLEEDYVSYPPQIPKIARFDPLSSHWARVTSGKPIYPIVDLPLSITLKKALTTKGFSTLNEVLFKGSQFVIAHCELSPILIQELTDFIKLYRINPQNWTTQV